MPARTLASSPTPPSPSEARPHRSESNNDIPPVVTNNRRTVTRTIRLSRRRPTMSPVVRHTVPRDQSSARALQIAACARPATTQSSRSHMPSSMRLERPGAELGYDSVGPADGGPIVQAHGILLSRAAEARLELVDWSPLVAAGFHHVRYDARAHGESSGRPEPDDYLWPALARDLLALVASKPTRVTRSRPRKSSRRCCPTPSCTSRGARPRCALGELAPRISSAANGCTPSAK